MLCARCKSFESKVVDTRRLEDHNRILRRRECLLCGHRWATYEIPAIELKGEMGDG